MKKHKITTQEYTEIKLAEQATQNKRVSKRLQVLMLRYEGKKDREIAEKLDYDRKRISQLCAEFKRVGLLEYARHKYGGNRRNMTDTEEKEFLSQFEEAAKDGKVTTISDIAAAYDEVTGKERESKSTVYYLLHKHEWRIITPQTRHPGKASDEVIEASKKLT